jgi:type I restriction enzyme S subunit
MSSEERRAMSDEHNEKSALVPRLRFPEFREAGGWNEAKLGELIAIVSPPAKLQSSSYLAKGEFPIIDQSQEFICGWTNDENTVIAEPLPLIVFGDHTCVIKFIDKPFAQGADGIKILKANPVISTELLFYSLHNRPLVMEDYKRHFSILKERVVFFPNIDSGEQQKIADCLSSLDELIAAQTNKLDALKTHKKGLMQQLFPVEGETVPRLRFPEFREAGEWEETTLGSIAKFASGGTPSKDVSEYWGGTTPWISASSMYETNLCKSDMNITDQAVRDGARIAKQGTLLILVRGSMLYTRVPMGIASVDVSFNQDVKALTIKNGINTVFLLYELLAYELRIPVDKTGIGAGKIETDELKRLPIYIPSSIEQQKIADCLSALDDLIAAQAQKIELLKRHKKGLMQQLFPVLDETPR